jgi:hypothetical protein
VRVNDGVTSLDAVASRSRINLLDARVRRLETVQTLLEQRAQSLVRLNGIDEDGVTADLGLVQDVKERRPGRLPLVRDVRVPGHRAGPRLEEVQMSLVVDAAVNEVDLGVAFGRARRGMDVVSSKVGAKLERVGNGQVGEVLVSEGHDLARGDEVSQLVFAGVAEGGQLDASHFGANVWSEVSDLDSTGEKVGVGCVGILSVLVVLKRRERRVLLSRVPCWEVVRVLDVGELECLVSDSDRSKQRLTLAAGPPALPSSASLSMYVKSISLYCPSSL